MSDPKIYTVGWICAITAEYVAAQAFLDEQHEGPEDLPPRNKNDYTLGRIGKHNIVISVLPMGEYGTSSAARVAEDMLHSFPNVRIGLMVGIGGGAPSVKHDVRLGDIVISIPLNGRSGVIQYDFGKMIQGQSFQPTGFLDQPPTILRAAVNGLRARYESEGHRLEEAVDEALKKRPRLRKKYKRPEPESDRLYQSQVVHPQGNGSSCPVDCGNDSNSLVLRAPRSGDEDNPAIHYGLIASANQLMKDALIRDRLATEMGVLCFEMEAAGMMNHFPCLVIRGICDYSDSHKNEEWQGYAAMVAAAYAKDLLYRIYPQQVEKEERISEILKPAINHVAKTLDRIDHTLALDKLLVASEAEYNSYTDQYEEECLQGTRTELLRQIMEWPTSPNQKSIFWLNGMAGTGKSTISRTVAKSLRDTNHLGASFFFKRGEGDRGNAKKFFPTLMKQLVLKIPELSSGVQKALWNDPEIASKSLGEQFEKLLLQPLLDLGRPDKQMQTAVIVIDGLDECEHDLDVQNIIRLLPLLQQANMVCLRVFLTSRPEPPIRLGFSKIADHDYQDLALHEIPDKVTEHDIRLFLKDRFTKIRSDRKISEDWPSDKVIQGLVTMSVPLFISAATVCRYIGNSKWEPKRRLEELLQDQARYAMKMDKTYLPILTRLLDDQDSDEWEQHQLLQEFQKIVGIIILLAIPFSVNALSHFLGIEPGLISHHLDLFQSVLSLPTNRDLPVRILHSSFRDFLVQSKSKFRVNEVNTHKEIALYCLKTMRGHLQNNICNLESPGTHWVDIDPQSLRHYLPPELRYSCRYWIYHLEHSEILSSEMELILVFLQEHFLHWVEVMSLLGLASEIIGMLNLLQIIIQDDQHSATCDFLQDAKRFILKNRQIADKAPLQIYCAGLIFAPQTSIVRRMFKAELPSWIGHLPRVEERWSAELEALEGHLDSVISVAFSPDNHLLASGSSDNTIRLWDPALGKLQQILKGHSGSIRAVAFSPDSQLLASGSGDKTIRLWDLATGTLQQTLEGHLDWVRTVAFVPDGRLLASGSDDKTIRLWDPALGTLQQILKGHSDSIRTVAFSPNSQLLASGSDDKTIRLWDLATGTLQQTLEGHLDSVNSVAFSSNSQLLASGSGDKTIRLWEPATGMLQQTLEGLLDWINSVAFSPDGRLLASASDDNTIRLWDLARGIALQQTLESHSGSVRTVAFSPDGRLLASGSGDKTVRLWDPAIGSTLQQTLENHSDLVRTVAFSPDGLLLASSSDDKTICLWDPVRGILQQTLKGHLGPVRMVAFSPNGQLLASGSDDQTVRLWDLSTGTLQKTLNGHSYSVSSVAFSPSGWLLASGSYDNTVQIWESATGILQQTLKGHLDWVNTVVFSPDGRLLASGSDDNTVRLWDPATGILQQTLSINGSVDYLEFSQDSLCLKTNLGLLVVQDAGENHTSRFPYRSLSIFVEQAQWIKLDGENTLWLPPEFRPNCSAINGNLLVLGHASGRVSFIAFRV
ncbi:putative wd40 protein [Aspergillus pseudoustus]|uniref:Wd40 protein n=1 Tax=Aspergillus pseudoustus TaxID=1810923 RepID=A0ABR4JH85_9EURO